MILVKLDARTARLDDFLQRKRRVLCKPKNQSNNVSQAKPNTFLNLLFGTYNIGDSCTSKKLRHSIGDYCTSLLKDDERFLYYNTTLCIGD